MDIYIVLPHIYIYIYWPYPTNYWPYLTNYWPYIVKLMCVATQPNFRINKFDKIPQKSGRLFAHWCTTTLETFTDINWYGDGHTGDRVGRPSVSCAMGMNSSLQIRMYAIQIKRPISSALTRSDIIASQKRPWSDQSVWTTEINKNWKLNETLNNSF